MTPKGRSMNVNTAAEREVLICGASIAGPALAYTHGMDGMDGMDGMMTGDDVDTLEKATGTAFDTAFLQMMIKHHEGAVDMARTEQAHGAYAPAKKMAGRIITSRSSETEQMNRLLGKS